MKKVLLGLLIVLVSCTNQNNKQIVKSDIKGFSYKVYSWNEDGCDYIGTYDSTKVSQLQIINSIDLVFGSQQYCLYNISVHDIYQLHELNIDSLDEHYSNYLANLEKKEVIQDRYWDNLKKLRIKELKKDWQLKRLMLLSYTYPDTLMSVSKSADCLKYALAIKTGGDELLKIWSELSEKMALNNGDPEKVRENFREKMASPENLIYAQMDVVSFGWWNSINNTLLRPNTDDYYEHLCESFVEVKQLCDEE